jgi:O-antigen ligase
VTPTRIAERAAFGAGVVFLFAAPFAASAGLRATCLILAALAIVVSGAWRRISPRALPTTVIALLGAWFALAALSMAWSADLRHTLEELRAETLYGALAFTAFFVMAWDERRWRPWWIALMAGTAATFIAASLQHASGVALWRHSPDGGVGAYSTHLVLVAPLLVALVAPPPWGIKRDAWLLGAALAALLLAAWMSRDAWSAPNRIVWPSLAMVFGVAALAARRAGGFELRSLPGLGRVLVATGVLLAAAFVASIAVKTEKLYPPDYGFATSVERDLRPRLWSAGWEEWKAAPWLGHGFGREIRARAFLSYTPAGSQHPPIHHAHNAILNIAIQLGIVGAALFVAVLVALAREYWLLLSQPALSTLGVIGLALLAGFVTKNLTDDFLHRHNAHVFWALNGMLLGFAAAFRAR